MTHCLDQLEQELTQRRYADPASSYVAQLHQRGLNKILEKVGEEATETLLAAKDAVHTGQHQDVINETADLWFHTLVMLSHLGLSHQQVLDELSRRMGISGLTEKASRVK